MKKFLIVILFMLICTWSRAQELKGVFPFGMAKNFLWTNVYELDYVSGMTTYYLWEDLEPKQGMYDFTVIDSMLELASQNDKIINVGVYAGGKCPDWVYQQGAVSFSWDRKWREDQAKAAGAKSAMETAPVMWDPVYVEAWKKFVVELARRYDGHRNIGYIALTGGTPKDLSTGTTIRNDADWQKLVDLGYTPEKHLGVWIDMVNHFNVSFKKTYLVLAIGPLRPGGTSNTDLARTVVNYVVDNQLTNIGFLTVFLNDRWFTNSRTALEIRELLRFAKKNGHLIGEQMVYSAAREKRYKNSRNKLITDFGGTLDIAVNDGASWIEVWHDDFIIKRTKQINQDYTTELKRVQRNLLEP